MTALEPGILADRVLGAGVDEPEALEAELTTDGPEERDALLARLDQCRLDSRVDEEKGKTGDSSPGADVHQTKGAGRELRQEQERVDEEPMDDPAGVLEPREVVHPVPFHEQLQVPSEALPILRGGGTTSEERNRREQLVERVGGGPLAGHAFFAARAGVFAAFAVSRFI